MSDVLTAKGVVRLPGHEAVPARADLQVRTLSARATRGGLALVGCWGVGLVVFFVPPHIPWAVIALASGVYFGLRQLRGEYVVASFSGECPRCHSALRIEPGTKIRLPHRMDCFECHHQPSFEIGFVGA
jgi:hypothetical protein